MDSPAAYKPYDDRSNETHKKGPYKRSVYCALSEEPSRTDDAPEYAAVEMYTSYWASESVDCLRGANVGNMVEHPIENAYLSDAGNKCGNHLDLEKKLGWDLHVVT